jgi:hypothetical protein
MRNAHPIERVGRLERPFRIAHSSAGALKRVIAVGSTVSKGKFFSLGPCTA